MTLLDYLLSPITSRLDRLERKIDAVLAQETLIMATLDDLVTEVTEIETTGDSVLALVNGLAAQIEALKIPDPRVDALVSRLRNQSGKFATAVQANTPANSNAPPVP